MTRPHGSRDEPNGGDRSLVCAQPGQPVVPPAPSDRAVVRRNLEALALGHRDRARALELLQRRLPLHRTDPDQEETQRAALAERLLAGDRQRLAQAQALWTSGSRNERIRLLKELDRWLELGEFDLLAAVPLPMLQDYIDHGQAILLLRFLNEDELIALNELESFPYAVVATVLAPGSEPGPRWRVNHTYSGARKFIQHLLRDWDQEDFGYIRHLLLRKFGRRAGRGFLLGEIERLRATFREDRRTFVRRLAEALTVPAGIAAPDLEKLITRFFRYDRDDRYWLEGQKALVMQRLAPLTGRVIDFQVFPPVVLDDQFAVDDLKGRLIDSLLLSGEFFCFRLEEYPKLYRSVELELIAEVWEGSESLAGNPPGGAAATRDAILARTLKGSFDYSLWNILGRRHTFALGEQAAGFTEHSQALVVAAPFPLPADLRPYLERHRRQVYGALADLKTIGQSVEVDEHEFFCSIVLPILEAIWRGQRDTACLLIGELGYKWSRTWTFDVPKLLSQCLMPLLRVLEKARPPSPAMKEALDQACVLIQAECSTRLTRVGESRAEPSWLGLPQLEIRLDRMAYRPGEMVQGVLMMTLARPTALRGLQVRLTGQAWANFLGSSNEAVLPQPGGYSLGELLGLRFFRDARSILEHDLLVAGDWDDRGGTDQPLELSAGEYRSRFAIELAQAAPPSYQGRYAGTRYTVMVRAGQGWLWTQNASADFAVLPLIPVREEQVVEFTQRYCTYNVPWEDRAFLRVLIRGAPFQAGERIQGTLTLQNLANQAAQSLSVCLVGIETAFSKVHQIRRTHSVTAVEQELCGEIPVGDAIEREFELEIPPDIPRSAGGHYFDFSWYVEVRIRYGRLDTLTAAKAVGIY